MSEWQPIETAPKDGTRILLFNPMAGIWITAFDWPGWPMRDWDGMAGVWYPQPSHWMPLPKAPEAS